MERRGTSIQFFGITSRSHILGVLLHAALVWYVWLWRNWCWAPSWWVSEGSGPGWISVVGCASAVLKFCEFLSTCSAGYKIYGFCCRAGRSWYPQKQGHQRQWLCCRLTSFHWRRRWQQENFGRFGVWCIPPPNCPNFSPPISLQEQWHGTSSIQFWVGANAMKTFLCEVPPLMGLVYLNFLAQFLGVTIQLISWVVSDWGWIPRSWWQGASFVATWKFYEGKRILSSIGW